MMYRYRLLAPLRRRPLEAAAGIISMLRGIWGVLWPTQVHDTPVSQYLINLGTVPVIGWLMSVQVVAVLVLASGIWQFRMAYVHASKHHLRCVPVFVQVVTIGIVLYGYLKYDHQDVATAFYLGMWLSQVWIWGDLHYARRTSA